MHRISVQLFLQAAFVMVMRFLWYNKSVYMDFRLTRCLHRTVLILWQAVGLKVGLQLSIFFSMRWFSGPSLVKLFWKVIAPSRYIESRHLTSPLQKNHCTLNKAGKFLRLPSRVSSVLRSRDVFLLLFQCLFAFIMYLHSCLWQYWQSL